MEFAEYIADGGSLIDRHHDHQPYIFVVAPAGFPLQGAGALQLGLGRQGYAPDTLAMDVQQAAQLSLVADGLDAVGRGDFFGGNQGGGGSTQPSGDVPGEGD